MSDRMRDKYELKRQKIIADNCIGNRVLDIGCAELPNSFLSNYCVVGYDLKRPVVTTDYYSEYIIGDVSQINNVLDLRSFETIIAGEFIEHLENPYKFLSDLHKHLSGPKRIILSTPNPFGIPVIIFELLRSKKYFYSMDHRYYFTPRWVERLLESSSFTVDKVVSIGFNIPKIPIVLPCPSILSYQLVYIAHSDL